MSSSITSPMPAAATTSAPSAVPTAQSQTTTRFHYMDSMRSVLMALGIVLHSAQVYNPEQGWQIFSDQTTIIATYLVQIIHSFRMPAFFVVSGFFCALTLVKYRPKKFLSVRLKRIALPLITTAVTLNILQLYLLNHQGWSSQGLTDSLRQGGWVSHLWFLVNLIFYFILASGLFALAQRLGLSRPLTRLCTAVTQLPIMVMLLALPLLSVIIHSLTMVNFPLYEKYFGFINVYMIVRYSPYFLFGYLLATRLDFIQRFNRFNPLYALSGVALSLLALKVSDQWVASDMLQRITTLYFSSLINWLMVCLCFYTFQHLADKASPFWQFMSEASYTIYLFHHILVIGLGLMLIELGIGPMMGLPMLIVGVTLVTVCIHKYLVLKTPLLRLLFNGK